MVIFASNLLIVLEIVTLVFLFLRSVFQLPYKAVEFTVAVSSIGVLLCLI